MRFITVRSPFRNATKHCESLNMSLWSPDLSSMYENMIEYKASIFWTGFRRFNNSFFYEKSSHVHLSCQTGFWKSQENKELGFSGEHMKIWPSLQIKDDISGALCTLSIQYIVYTELYWTLDVKRVSDIISEKGHLCSILRSYLHWYIESTSRKC